MPSRFGQRSRGTAEVWMLHWKNRTALLVVALASVIAAVGDTFIWGHGAFW
jgi:hypothetical protein